MLAITTIAFASQAQQSPQAKQNASAFPAANAALTYKIINTTNNTYSYDVFVNEKLFIHQTSIPAQPGNEGFKTKQDASAIALLVIEKIKKGEMPPTISIDEMKKLNVVK